MTNKSLKQETTLKDRFKERNQLIKPFLKKYNDSVIVHSIDKKSVFKTILSQNILKLPNNHKSKKKTPYMEKLLKIDNAIYFSLGFVYSTAYNWKYNLIFDINYLKNCKYYSTSINYQCYKEVINFLEKKDKKYLEKIQNKNNLTKEVFNKYYTEKYKGKTKQLLDFWKIEKILYDAIQNYKNKSQLLKIIKETEKKFKIKYPLSIKDSQKAHIEKRVPEIISLKENNLLKNKYFLGFYIKDKVPKDILTILNKKYKDKIIFDGKIINKLIINR
jgi:hypothetical protein